MQYIQINISTNNISSDELIAYLSDLGFDGFEELENEIAAFIQKDNFNESAFSTFIQQYQLSSTQNIIEEQNWNAVWESNFQPITVDDFVGVRANFHEPILNVEHEIVITPKMSFGTGHHATTYMMMQLMNNIDFSGKAVADFGTGTGLLAILSEKLGAASVLATDNDDWCIENATENGTINACKNIQVKKVTDFNERIKFDVVLANINKNIILDNSLYLIENTKNNGILLLSGLLQEDENEILNIFKQHNFNHIKTLHSKQWIAIWLNKQQ